MIILPSVASSNLADPQHEISQLGNYPYLHFDIEDGNFVPNITFGIKTIRALRGISRADFDAHLMVTNPAQYIPDLISLNFTAIAFHIESTAYPYGLIQMIKKAGLRVGIALNPKTGAEELLRYSDIIDYVLVMATEPDGFGERFQPHILSKIRQIRASAPDLTVVVDGDINADTLPLASQAGANAAVIGRGVFSAPCPAKAIEEFSNMV